MQTIQTKLEKLGFTSYEAKAYEVLLKQGYLTASEISRISKIPQARIYNILDKLEQKGFCSTAPGSIKKFNAIDPVLAINNLIENKKKELQSEEAGLLQIAEVLSLEFNKTKKSNSPMDYIQVYTSRPGILEKYTSLIVNLKTICRTFNKPPYATNRNFNDPVKGLEPIVDKIKTGIPFNAIWEIEEDNLNNFNNWILFWERVGENVRIHKKLPLKLLIADSEASLFTLSNRYAGKNDLTSLVLEHVDFTFVLIELFEKYWAESMTIDEYLESIQLTRKMILENQEKIL